MKLRYKILYGILGVLAVAVVSLAITLSYEIDCGPAPEVAGNVETMRAAVARCYGSADILGIVLPRLSDSGGPGLT